MEFNKESAIAIARLAGGLIVTVAAMLGFAVDGDMIVNVLLAAIGVVLFFISWWKNANITPAAQEAQKVLDEIKIAEKETKDVV